MSKGLTMHVAVADQNILAEIPNVGISHAAGQTVPSDAVVGYAPGCIFQKLNGAPFKEVADWMEHYRVFWEESFDRLEAYLKTVHPTPPKGKKHGRKK